MALDSPKYERMFSETGTDDDKISGDEFGVVKETFDQNDYIKDKHKLESQGHLIYMLDKVTQELDYLRTKILANESCCSTQTSRTHITTSQASAIADNTKKVPITETQSSAITDNTAKVGITPAQARAINANTGKAPLIGGVGTALSFGEMITQPPPKGGKTPTYSIIMTAQKSGVSKSVKLTLT